MVVVVLNHRRSANTRAFDCFYEFSLLYIRVFGHGNDMEQIHTILTYQTAKTLLSFRSLFPFLVPLHFTASIMSCTLSQLSILS